MKKNIIVFLLITTGIGCILYPFISNFITGFNQTKLMVDYQTEVGVLTDEEKEEKIENAQKYNDELEKDIHVDVSLKEDEKVEAPSHLNVLDIGDKIGFIKIPKIDVNLPIYHGTSDKVLKSGVGHLETSSLPVGGKGTHAVLAGHTGLANGKIFDNIDKLEIGDIFYIIVLNKSLQYRVNNIVTVTPDDAKSIKVDTEKDYVTLVTCTPKFINSHRLLVRGERVIETKQEENKDSKEKSEGKEQKSQMIFSNVTKEIKSFIDENGKITILVGSIFILIGILIWSHKFIKIDNNNEEKIKMNIENKTKENTKNINKEKIKNNLERKNETENEEKIENKFKKLKSISLNNGKYKYTISKAIDITIEQCIEYYNKKELIKRGLTYNGLKFYIFSNKSDFSDMIFMKNNKIYVIHYDSTCEKIDYKEMTKYIMNNIKL